MSKTHVIVAGLFFLLCACAHSQEPKPQQASAPTRPDTTPVLAANSIVHGDVPYGGPDARLDVLDIYAPHQAQNAPVMIFIHGGEWSRGDKREISSLPRFFNSHGMLLVCPNYRLSPKDVHPAQVDDLARAIAWCKAHIAEYGGNPQRLFLMGHSAGCHLATLLALDGEYLAKMQLKPTDLRGVIAWSGGMYDLPDRYQAGGSYHPFIEATFGASAQAQRLASPITFVGNAAAAPPFLFASVDDPKSAASRQATEEMVRQLTADGGKAQSVLLINRTHSQARDLLGADGDQTGQIILDFLTAQAH